MGVVSGLVGGAVVLAAAALSYGGVLFHQYGDVRVFTDGTGLGRTKNSVAALIAGEIGRKLREDSEFTFVV